MKPPATRPTTRHERTAATPIAFVQAIVLAYERYGVDPSEALRQARIAPSLLRRPQARITAGQMEAVCGHAMRELDDEALGWYARKLPWGSYGMLCRASLSAPDLGVALKRWCRHHRLLTDDVLLHLDTEGPAVTLAIEARRPLGRMREFCLVSSLRFVHGYACWAVDSRIPLLEAGFPFAAPAHRDVYPLLFPGPVRFEADRAFMRLDAQYLSLPIKRDERALQSMLQRALPLTVLQYRRDRLLVQRVRALLRSHANQAHTAEAVARLLHVSPRTLHRQLREEGASLQALKDEVRRDEAIDQLQRSARSVKQVAHAVGFGSEKSFARAFRQWTGASPSAFRSEAPAKG